MPVGRLKKVEIEDRRRKVAALLLRRIPQWRIADQMQLSKCMVSRDVSALLRQWRQEAADCTAQAVGQELAALDALEYDCALQFSKKKNVEWIHARLRIMERRGKMLGLDDPEVHRLVGANGGPIEVVQSGSALARQVLEDPEARRLARALHDRLADVEKRRDRARIVGENGHLRLPDSPRLN